MWETPTIVNPDAGNILKAVTFSDCVIRKTEGDPKGDNRVQVECPVKSGVGKENYTSWVEVGGMPIGGTHNKGDTGISWPMSPRQRGVLVNIDGDPMNQIVFPAGPSSESKDSKVGLLPKETANAIKKKQGHNIYQLKTPDGSGLTITTTVNKEQLIIQGPSGCLVFNGGIKGKEPTQKEGEETKPRPPGVYTRNTDTQADGTQKAPGEIFKDKAGYVRLLGQNGSGITMIDAEDGSGMIIRCADSKNANTGPSIIMSSKDGGSIIFSVGSGANKFQLKLRGKTGDMKSTKTIIQEDLYFPVEESMIKPVTDLLVKASKESLFSEVSTA
jgi:hypothetical protein